MPFLQPWLLEYRGTRHVIRFSTRLPVWLCSWHKGLVHAEWPGCARVRVYACVRVQSRQVEDCNLPF